MQMIASVAHCTECMDERLEIRPVDSPIHVQSWERAIDVPDEVAMRLLVARVELAAAENHLLLALGCSDLDEFDGLLRATP